MGRTPQGIENRKKAIAESRKRRRKNDPEYAAKMRLKSKQRREKKLDEYRAKGRAYYHANKDRIGARKKQYIEANRERQREYNRAYYAANREFLKQQIAAGKLKRDPTRGVVSLILRFRRGDISVDELFESVGERALRVDERVALYAAGRGSEVVRHGPCELGCLLCKSNSSIDEDKDGATETC